jgi:uncharacterized protein
MVARKSSAGLADAEHPGDVGGRIDAFLAAHTTLNLASVDESGLPAAAAVFYAHDEAFRLYFLSELRTQHGQNLLANPAVSGTIQADGQDWRTISGLQLSGRASLVKSTIQLVRVAAIYGRKFPFVRPLLEGMKGEKVLSGPLVRARFWVIQPTWFRLVDNTVRFGFKEEFRPEEFL